MNAHIAIISARRPHAVKKMQEFAPNATWYVAHGESRAYEEAGAANVIEAGSLVTARNYALEDAFDQGLPCLQLSDDLQKLQIIKLNKELGPTNLDNLLKTFDTQANWHGVKLVGVAPTTNPFFFHEKRAIQNTHFCIGDMIYVLPSTPRFDPNIYSKEDYDFTAQHIMEYDGVARLDYVFATFLHYTNAGGAVGIRNEESEQEVRRRLIAKWGSAIKLNKKRKNEILFDGKQLLKRKAIGG
jgi:hypothetical protein